MNISPKELNDNIFKLIADDWMLITAGNNDKVNTMTASFGGFGVLFFKNVAHIYVRPERYTFNFLEQESTFSLSFFNDNFKEKLKYCGRVSGKNEDKIKISGLKLLYSEDNTPYFEQAKITILCKKIYSQDISAENFIDKASYEKTYASGGMHRMYIGEITNIIIK